MFSGIVETTGLIELADRTSDCMHFSIAPDLACDDLKIGDSVAVNGVCLTVTEFTNEMFRVTAVAETLRLTNLGNLSLDSVVNLERSLKFDGRIGGHYVQGHVDYTGEILDLQHDGESSLLVKISVNPEMAKYIVNKGYITIDGMSITVIEATNQWFTAMFIPHTQELTIVKYYKKGTLLNIEVDIWGKYAEKRTGTYST